MAASIKSGAKILIIGHNKIGKSHLINKFIGQDKAAGAAAGGAMIGSRFFWTTSWFSCWSCSWCR